MGTVLCFGEFIYVCWGEKLDKRVVKEERMFVVVVFIGMGL